MSSVTATRRVSGSSGITSRTKSTYSLGSSNDSSVEAVDASNRVAVKSELERDGRGKNRHQQEAPEFEANPDMLIDSTYVESALEALSASGIYDEKGLDMALVNMANVKNVGVYAHNNYVITGEKAPEKTRSSDSSDGYLYDDWDEYADYYEDEEDLQAPPVVEEVDKFI